VSQPEPALADSATVQGSGMAFQIRPQLREAPLALPEKENCDSGNLGGSDAGQAGAPVARCRAAGGQTGGCVYALAGGAEVDFAANGRNRVFGAGVRHEARGSRGNAEASRQCRRQTDSCVLVLSVIPSGPYQKDISLAGLALNARKLEGHLTCCLGCQSQFTTHIDYAAAVGNGPVDTGEQGV